MHQVQVGMHMGPTSRGATLVHTRCKLWGEDTRTPPLETLLHLSRPCCTSRDLRTPRHTIKRGEDTCYSPLEEQDFCGPDAAVITVFPNNNTSRDLRTPLETRQNGDSTCYGLSRNKISVGSRFRVYTHKPHLSRPWMRPGR